MKIREFKTMKGYDESHNQRVREKMKYINLFVIQGEALVFLVVWELGLHLVMTPVPTTAESGEFDS